MRRISLLTIVCIFLGGCAGYTSYSYVSSDLPFVADLVEPLVISGPSTVLCTKPTHLMRSAEVGTGPLNVGSAYKEVCTQ